MFFFLTLFLVYSYLFKQINIVYSKPVKRRKISQIEDVKNERRMECRDFYTSTPKKYFSSLDSLDQLDVIAQVKNAKDMIESGRKYSTITKHTLKYNWKGFHI